MPTNPYATDMVDSAWEIIAPLLQQRNPVDDRAQQRITRSAIISTRSRVLSLYHRYHRTHKTMISWSNCRPLNKASTLPDAAMAAIIQHPESLHHSLRNDHGISLRIKISSDSVFIL
jgi:transposase